MGNLWKGTLKTLSTVGFSICPLPSHLYLPIIAGKHLATLAGEVWAQEPQLPDPDGWPPAGKSTNCHAPGGT